MFRKYPLVPRNSVPGLERGRMGSRRAKRAPFAGGTPFVRAGGVEGDERFGGDVLVADKPKIKKARRWAVMFYNDDYTTKWFVVMVLQEYFRMGSDAATAFMMAVHRAGKGAAAFYTKDIAETKAAQVMERAKEYGMPLKVEAEPEEEDDREG